MLLDKLKSKHKRLCPLDIENNEVSAAALVNIGRIYKKQRQFANAEPYFRHALNIYKSSQKNDSQKMADTLDSVAWTVGNEGKYDEASALYKQELAVTKKLLGEKNILNCTGCKIKKVLIKEALPFLNQAYELTKIQEQKPDGWLTVSLTTLANIYRDHQEYQKAKYIYEIVLPMSDKTLFLQNNLFKADIMKNYAKLLHETRQEDKVLSLESAAKNNS